jgi:outer membrane protein OmpA-like peptidoglycan-associated protein
VKLPLQNRNSFEAGALARNKDAIAIYAGYQWNNLMAGFSYDANISGVTGGPGAFELTLTYIPKAKEKKEKPAKPEKEKPEPKKNVPATKAHIVTPVPPAVKPQEVKPEPPAQKIIPPVQPQAVKTPAPVHKREPVITVTPAPRRPQVKLSIPIHQFTPVVRPQLKLNIPEPVREPAETILPAKKLLTVNIKVPVQNYSPVSRVVTKVTPPALKRDTTAVVVPAPKPVPVIKPDPKPVVKAPEPDTDGDGIPDASDKCVYIKGPGITNGCPDSDQDGIADSDDACPMVAGLPENKGCPKAAETAPAPAITKSVGRIEFKTNSDEIKGIVRFEVIEPIVDFLYYNKEYRIVISGHTDSEGTELFNMQLSQKRADAIKAILIRKGVEESRISTVAYGETVPLGNNRTDAGKAANRRAEIHLVK